MGQTETFQTELFDCEPLHARITLRQCKLNRQRSRSEFPGQAYHCRTCRQQPQPVAATVTIAEGEKERLTPAGQEWLVKVVSGRKGSSNKPAKPEVLPSTPAIRAVTAPEIEGGGGYLPRLPKSRSQRQNRRLPAYSSTSPAVKIFSMNSWPPVRSGASLPARVPWTSSICS